MVPDGVGLEVSLPLKAVEDFVEDDWTLLVVGLLRDDIVLVGQQAQGLHQMRFCRGGDVLAIYRVYSEAMGVIPADEGDEIFIDWVRKEMTEQHLIQLVGVMMFYATVGEGGTNAEVPVPAHIMAQVQQVRLILSFRDILRGSSR